MFATLTSTSHACRSSHRPRCSPMVAAPHLPRSSRITQLLHVIKAFLTRSIILPPYLLFTFSDYVWLSLYFEESYAGEIQLNFSQQSEKVTLQTVRLFLTQT